VAESTYDKFRGLLAELFMFDRADLDFGIYRIMNAKRDEVTRFLDHDLLPQVKATLSEVDQGQRAQLQAELEKVEQACAVADVDPDASQRVQDLRQALKATGDPEALAAEVFSDLYNFFRRYYKDGDFISLRRYKEGVYAIPYEGEEVKLYWANHDQYYIKSGEYFRDYAFKLPDGRRVRFKLVQADEERDNTKAPAGQERRFMLSESDPIREEKGDDGAAELIIPFEYKPDSQKRKREELIAEAARTVMESEAAAAWLSGLAAAAPTEKNSTRTLLEKHLSDYTARNTFDYFIHKDLGGFLRRELDFFIKNEVMHLDDIEAEGEQRVAQYLAKIRAIRRIGHKTIDFLAQLEDFQKKLWLKKKFVVETNYCVTLDRVADELHPETAANEAQRQEWVRLFAIDEIADDLTQPGYSEPLTVEFLKANPSLVLDTAHFSVEFKERLLASFDDLDEQTDGLLIHSENFQALNLLQQRYREQVKCVYIDPPYNTDASPILYKNGYRRSSWVCLLRDRLEAERDLREPCSITCIAIDDYELPDLRGVLESLSSDTLLATAAIRSKPQGRPTATGFSSNHEYAVFWGSAEARIGRLERKGSKARRYPYSDERGAFAWSNFRKSGTDSDRSDRPKSYYPVYVSDTAVRVPNLTWIESSQTWRVDEVARADEQAVWPVDSDGREKVWTCSPQRARRELGDIRAQRDADERIEVYKKYRPNQEGALPGTWWDDSSYSASESGTKVLKDVFAGKDFDFPKSVALVRDCLKVAGLAPGSTTLDYFAGSATTGHAVINLNREDGGRRRFILVEMADYFDTVLLPRLKKVTYTPEWKDGKPKRRASDEERERGPHLIKYLRLESYEDALNNLELRRSADQDELLAAHPDLREDYTLRYMLDVESAGSASLLDLDRFDDPFSYTLQVSCGSVGETRPVTVDLVETFNYLLGLRVRHIDSIRGFKVVEGASPQGERVLVIWRNTREKSNADLDEFFQKQGYATRDSEFDVIYVNGDNNLENLRRPDETWKVRLIEDEFKRLMFDVEDV
jgi:adenine-specific DNA-methyltransferase